MRVVIPTINDRHWWVVSPVMAEVIPILDDGSGPIEEFCDVVSVAAPNKRAAVVAGVKLMEKWPTEARAENRNPFAGVEARDTECEHGFCWCDLDDCDRGHEANGHGDYCEVCDAEHRREPS